MSQKSSKSANQIFKSSKYQILKIRKSPDLQNTKSSKSSNSRNHQIFKIPNQQIIKNFKSPNLQKYQILKSLNPQNPEILKICKSPNPQNIQIFKISKLLKSVKHQLFKTPNHQIFKTLKSPSQITKFLESPGPFQILIVKSLNPHNIQITESSKFSKRQILGFFVSKILQIRKSNLQILEIPNPQNPQILKFCKSSDLQNTES